MTLALNSRVSDECTCLAPDWPKAGGIGRTGREDEGSRSAMQDQDSTLNGVNALAQDSGADNQTYSGARSGHAEELEDAAGAVLESNVAESFRVWAGVAGEQASHGEAASKDGGEDPDRTDFSAALDEHSEGTLQEEDGDDWVGRNSLDSDKLRDADDEVGNLGGAFEALFQRTGLA